MSTNQTRRAYSYIRFSTPEQAKGGSLQRQTDLAQSYCKRRGWFLDPSLTLHDLGVSAFRGTNALVGNMKTFLDAIKAGTVRPGSALIVESVDRISRQGIDEGYDLCKGILKNGVHLVTLQPEREFGPEAVKSLSKGALELQLILERAAEESEMKSHRRKSGWKLARDKARAGGGPMSKQCPAWLEVTDDGFRVKDKAAAAIRRIYAMAIDGLGVHRIADKLTETKVPPIGTGDRWVKAYVYRILTNPAAMGTLQPKKLHGKKFIPDGEPIPNYYPAVVTSEEWNSAQNAIKKRAGGRSAGRRGAEETNLFTGLLRDGLTREKFHIVNALGRKGKGERRRYRYLTPTRETGVPAGERFDYSVFEAAILSFLTELRPSEILPPARSAKGSKAQIAHLSARLIDIDSRLERTRQRARTASDFDAFLDLMQDLQVERKQVVEQRTELEQVKEGKAGVDLDEAQSLIAALEKTSLKDREDFRRRLRLRIAQLVSEMWMVIVPCGSKRLCIVQIFFRGSDRRRDYLILHVPGNRYSGGYWKSKSWLGNDLKRLGFCHEDLRDIDDAHCLARRFEGISPGNLALVFPKEFTLNNQFRGLPK